MITQELTPKEAVAQVLQARLLAKRAMVAAQSAIDSLTEVEYALKQAESFVMPLLESKSFVE